MTVGRRWWGMALGAILAAALAAPAGLAAAEYPDPKLTPGDCRCATTVKAVCGTKWGKDERHVTTAMKIEAYRKYGIPIPVANGRPVFPKLPNGRPAYEVDHACSRELGGCDTQANLGPQPYTGAWNAHMKDRLENRLHAEVCAGRLELSAAQRTIKGIGWRAAWQHYFGAPPSR